MSKFTNSTLGFTCNTFSFLIGLFFVLSFENGVETFDFSNIKWSFSSSYEIYTLFASLLMRLIMLSVPVVSAFIFTFAFVLCNSMSKSAHSPLKLLHKIMSHNMIVRNVKLKIKVITLIDKLSGPVIGFYHFSDYPITNYYLIAYMINFCSNFMLLHNLFADSYVQIKFLRN